MLACKPCIESAVFISLIKLSTQSVQRHSVDGDDSILDLSSETLMHLILQSISTGQGY